MIAGHYSGLPLQSTIVRILFLGASRAVELLGRFADAARDLGVELDMLAAEPLGEWHPVVVSGLARPVSAPPCSSFPPPTPSPCRD